MTPGRAVRPGRALAIGWIVAGVLGWVVSFLLYHEYIGQLRGAEALISCDISPIVTCGPNLLSPGGNLLGFSNSIIGLVLFPGAVFAGVSALAAPAGLRAWYWRVFAAFVAGAFVFVHVLAFRSIFEYGSLCPWCMVVWLVTIPLFWSTVGWSLRAGLWGSAPERVGAVLLAWTPLVVVIDYLVIAVAAQLRLDVLGSL
ncbi:vitamin K epoxide reductase family protein [Microbacterium imperiale]|uniref:Membrane protein n=1 Tax=Microbacterium imperiale TaxID=33884 RepID=A0A9W6HHU0_9MICO|nr:vitamin K epoxide reductase family protein [Microbacterium imperiale]MBP2420420.1 putative membrane protein [Microbacterium imperiale]MDS0197722.1 vitamin K epoxide reductase family protein [Microbacterium imperiale]BFE40762.1 vitamin K epoxide reductase family protein [Microbacterium imperiale]GLJ80093.1 membrane protein [Microbacterium imperiale]